MANLKDIGYGVGKYLETSDASSIPGIGNNRKNIDLLNFKVATNNAYTLYNFKDGMIDAYQTQEGVDATTSTGEIYDSSGKYYNNAYSVSETYTASASSTDWVCPAGLTSVAVKCWGGGGDHIGSHDTGSGGAGSYVGGDLAVTAGKTYKMVAAEYANADAYTGGGLSGIFDTSITFANAEVVAGGGGGAGGVYRGGKAGDHDTNGQDADGGYGNNGKGATHAAGGANGSNGNGGYGNAESGSALNGGDAATSSGLNAERYYGAGRGSNASMQSGGGGAGYYGGGGGDRFTTGGNNNGCGGGGGTGYLSPNVSNKVGEVGSGNDGAAPNTSDSDYVSPTAKGGEANSGKGGGGLLVISGSGIGNMTLESNAQTAQADPTEGRLMLYEEDVDAITLDTDLKGYVSRDGGTTYTQTPLVEDIIYESQAFNQGGIDANTALMLHFDGSNGGTTFTDNAPSPHTIMVSGNTNTSTAQKKFGTASGYFDGTGDFLRIATSGDGSYVMGTGNFTVDFWAYDVKVADPDSTVVQIGRGQYGACIGYVHSGGYFALYLSSSNGGWQIASATSMGALPGAAWAHYALVRNGNTWTTYKDGTQVSQFSSSASLYVGDEDMQIGRYTYTDNSTTNEMEGYIDELRVSKGVARWTADFTPPTAPYSTGAAAEAYTRRLVSGSVDISGQPSGTDMKYKVETLNNKNLKLHGASLLWA